MEQIKEELYQLCLEFIERRIETAKTALEQARESSNDDTKSSAGDKYETSREMMQQEIDRNKRLLMDAEDNMRVLKSIELHTEKFEQVMHGSLVETSQGWFYISVSAGHLVAKGKDVFAISPVSPIGKLLTGKKRGETFSFNGKEYKVEALV